MGTSSAAKVSRYERFEGLPALKVALAYEAIFGTSVDKLFAGVFDEVNREVVRRAKTLSRRLQKKPPSSLTARKLEMLRIIIVAPDIIAENE